MPTIDDIARELGISSATVSRALNGSRLVSVEVRQKVEGAAQKLGYEKRQIRRHRGRAILSVKLVLPRHAEPERALFYDFAALIEGLRRGFTLCGLNLLCEVNSWDFEPYPHKKGGDIDAFVFAFQRPSQQALRSLREHGTPFVILNRSIPGLPCVGSDHAGGMLDLLDHLRSKMADIRPRFVSIEGIGQVHEERLDGFEQACRRRGITFDRSKDAVVFPDISSIQTAGVAAAAKGANALVCVNDIVGTVILSELDRLGIDVPSQMAVTGFDDSPVRRLSRPLLTTVSLPVEELARYAATRLQAEIIENEAPAALLRVAGHLIPGESTP
ncbi:LacI family DNA-binding transcriptional regulator [Luteolibacter luteus]|uniref:LacI family transcriptional regulator n=1 Tax=Luteolibacter luteus TaxID=2728835 RepID=A0A858RNP2_9BACT|nr:LacI family DNA-binding transcriptional regulator [Luteolibacter luteus]QJE98482.1 LacI family transcriptional regulator [Luteolibacter luteus]